MPIKTRFAIDASLLMLFLTLIAAPGWAQSPGQYPIAAVTGGNVWLYDLFGNGLKVSSGRGFHDPIWNPDGSVLAFVGPSSEGDTQSIYITDYTGYPPVELVHGYLDFPVSFAPDGNLVYGLTIVPDPTPNDAVQQIEVYQVQPQAGAAPEYIGTFDYTSGCGGGASYDPSQTRYFQETDARPYPYILAATPWGIVHNTTCDGTDEIRLLETEQTTRYGAFMPQDRSQMFTLTANGFARIMNGTVGTEYVAAAPPDRLGFSPPGSRDIYYSTRTLVEPITLPDNIVSALQSNAFFPRLERYSVSLYRLNFATGVQDQLYTAAAYGIGGIFGLADGSGLVFSQIPNPDDWAKALSNGTITLQDIAAGNYHADEYSRVELYKLDFSNGKTRKIGTDMNTFALNTVIPSAAHSAIFTPIPTPLPPTTTPPTFALNTQVIVNPGIQALNVRETPATNAVIVEILPGGASMTITGGPVEAEGYTWWHVLLPSENEGWVAEYVDGMYMIHRP